MIKSLVCVSDGLVKLRIKRILSGKNLNHTITEKPIKRDDLIRHDLVIIHSSYNLPNLYTFIENAVYQKLATFIYVTTNVNSNPFRKFNDHINLLFIDENRMDVELPKSIELYSKYSAQITDLNKENRKLAKDLEELQLMNACKRKFIKDGYTEEEAHKYILKYAMDNHIEKIDACKSLLSPKS